MFGGGGGGGGTLKMCTCCILFKYLCTWILFEKAGCQVCFRCFVFVVVWMGGGEGGCQLLCCCCCFWGEGVVMGGGGGSDFCLFVYLSVAANEISVLHLHRYCPTS